MRRDGERACAVQSPRIDKREQEAEDSVVVLASDRPNATQPLQQPAACDREALLWEALGPGWTKFPAIHREPRRAGVRATTRIAVTDARSRMGEVAMICRADRAPVMPALMFSGRTSECGGDLVTEVFQRLAHRCCVERVADYAVFVAGKVHNGGLGRRRAECAARYPIFK